MCDCFCCCLKLTGNFDECVRNDTDDTDVCVSLIVMPGIWASEYALPLLLLSFNGAGGILYGGLGIFVLSSTAAAAAADDFNVVNLFSALDANDAEDDNDDDSNDNDNGVSDGVDIID